MSGSLEELRTLAPSLASWSLQRWRSGVIESQLTINTHADVLKNMARPQTISDEAIIEAARALFIEHGVGASTVEIATRAGISEGTIFRRFGTKDALLLRAMGLPNPDEWMKVVDGLPGRNTPRENMETIMELLLRFFSKIAPRIALMKAAGIHPRELFEAHDGPPPPVRTLRSLTNYFDAEMRLGRLRRKDPEIVARAFMASAHSRAMTKMLGVADYMPMAETTFIRLTVDLLLDGINNEVRDPS